MTGIGDLFDRESGTSEFGDTPFVRLTDPNNSDEWTTFWGTDASKNADAWEEQGRPHIFKFDPPHK